MKKISLRPYHGEIYLCKSPKEMKSQYKKLTKEDCTHAVNSSGGRYIKLEGDNHNDTKWLVYGEKKAYLAHEFAHVLLKTFALIGHDPTQGDGEPFCYMLSQLLLEAKN